MELFSIKIRCTFQLVSTLKDGKAVADLEAGQLHTAVRKYSGTLACDHRVDKLAELQQKICAVSSVFPQKNLLQFFRGVFG